MSSPHLTDDCIHNILKYLQNYHSTLFNCLLVNRFWCKETVPLLYADPFEDVMDFMNDKTHKYSIIFTLILCFDKSEILRFKDQLNKINNKNDININNEPLFEYPKYIENYYCNTVNNIIFEWFKNYYNIPSNNEIVKKFIPTFHQSNLRYSFNIKQFGISLNSFYVINYNIGNFTQNLSKLNSLSLQDINAFNYLTQEFLKSVANICLNLKKLEISSITGGISKETKEDLCTIIQNQNKLEAFKISRSEILLNNILLSLESQNHSLVYIEFDGIDFEKISFKNFINLYNLKYLNFGYCVMLSIEDCNLLNFTSFKLKELTLTNNDWKDDVTLSIIQYLGESLQKLDYEGSLTLQIIEYLSLYCLNLDSLKVKITPLIDSLIFPYFKNLRINKLILFIYDGSISDTKFTDKMMANLTENFIPINIKEIFISLYIHDFHIETFFENYHHNNLEMINLDVDIDSVNFKSILNYIERSNNNLKFLGIKELERELKDEEMKLLDQIKAKGIKLVDLPSIYCESIPIAYHLF
ncbi:hypothetical protein RclHR1_14760007 [Rhizophagus clarus]|uniref:F-box domain-containing protein n=1 Tax=Rhizophagus clarus TaxID=94130 RepID=A0A2Z6QFA2_9GLOM|nr:hypothetical protein RclHR1_14760007 [Rhizophagus clarus]GES75660.1 hypothetical protein GLOIN_2v1791592 [Rhizophagus clarus]